MANPRFGSPAWFQKYRKKIQEGRAKRKKKPKHVKEREVKQVQEFKQWKQPAGGRYFRVKDVAVYGYAKSKLPDHYVGTLHKVRSGRQTFYVTDRYLPVVRKYGQKKRRR